MTKKQKEKQEQETSAILAELQDKHGLVGLLTLLAENQKEAWDNYACKFGEDENITKFYDKAYSLTDKLADKIFDLKKKYPTLTEV